MIVFIIILTVPSLWVVFLIARDIKARLKTISEIENKISLFKYADDREGGKKIRHALGKHVDGKQKIAGLLDAEEQKLFDIGYHNYMKSFLKGSVRNFVSVR